MTVTRSGVRRAASALWVGVSVFVFLAVLGLGGTLGGALSAGFVWGLPFAFVHLVASTPEAMRDARANWRISVPTLAVAYALVFGWTRYMAATGMTKPQRLHATLLVAPILPLLMLVAVVVQRKGLIRRAAEEDARSL